MLPKAKPNPEPYNRRRLLFALATGAIMFLAFMGMGGCSPSGTLTPTTSLSILPSPTAAATETALAPTPEPVDSSTPLTLTLWLPPEMAYSAGTSGNILYQLDNAFIQANPDVHLQVIPKAAYGSGGLANMALTTHRVVPERIPDIIAVDTSELYQLSAEGMLVPLDDLIDRTVWDDVFPFAKDIVTFNGHKLAIPFQADITFLAYNKLSVPNPPTTWGQLAALQAKYLFPAGNGIPSVDAFLLQYLACGGTLVRDDGQPYLDSTIAAQVLAQYQKDMQSGVISGKAREATTLEECWLAYKQGDVQLVMVGSWLYQRDRIQMPNTRYAAIPTADGTPATVARSWSWAILTQDPVKQQIAANYILAALQPEILSGWSNATRHLPLRYSALALTIKDQDYRAFLEQELQNAYPYPDSPYYDQLQEIIIRAIEDVLDGMVSPDHAAADAAAMVTRLR